ncbi:HipA family kinase [Agriterribacter sp.]|uniref:HipA family kinase n=1 Tax=Agriterribacter sp. TaxID=2821509 RepID=UPI002CCE5356|nr:HipA family kinase [Agriterribacter sp.]HTN09045.1 HipA family kinase [Agriterribacter sp.]
MANFQAGLLFTGKSDAGEKISYKWRILQMSHTTALLRTVNVTRYVTPLREGGSLPAIAEADDGFLYVLKFRGAGQGIKALIAELLGGEIARVLGLKVPEIVFAYVDEAFGRTEPDEEIQDLLKFSEGLNLALHYLSGAIAFDPAVTIIDAKLASQIVWLDSLITNVDRTSRNTNMLMWHKALWLIDHGASLYFHHSWDNWEEQAIRPFTQVKDHVLLPWASELESVNETFRSMLTPERIRAIVSMIPDDWLTTGTSPGSAGEKREVYIQFLTTRVAHSAIFVKEAQHAREAFI